MPKNVPEGSIDEPLWLKFACNEEKWDVHELPTWAKNHPRILAYLESVPYMKTTEYMYKDKGKMVGSGYKMSELDETSWCSCFVNWCLKRAGMHAPNYGRAKDWIKYGTGLEHKDVKLGAIAILYKKPEKKTAHMTRSGWHVGFYIGGTAGVPVLLGGNQDNGVCRKPLEKYEAKNIYYRWPIDSSTAGKKK